MKDEIKEILDRLEIVAIKHTIEVEVCDDGSRIETMPASLVDELRLNNYSSKLLLDYITNLKTIEKEYSPLLSENAELENRIKELEQINEEHRRINGELRKTINEAIEYIKSNLDNTNWLELGSQDVEVLLNILKGSDE